MQQKGLLQPISLVITLSLLGPKFYNFITFLGKYLYLQGVHHFIPLNVKLLISSFYHAVSNIPFYFHLKTASIYWNPFQTNFIFRFDFELFNYSLNGYLEIGQPDQDPSALLAAITMKDNKPNSIPHIYWAQFFLIVKF